MISSGALPKVAFRSPPTASPVRDLLGRVYNQPGDRDQSQRRTEEQDRRRRVHTLNCYCDWQKNQQPVQGGFHQVKFRFSASPAGVFCFGAKRADRPSERAAFGNSEILDGIGAQLLGS